MTEYLSIEDNVITSIIKSRYPGVPMKFKFSEDGKTCLLHLYDSETICIASHITWKDLDRMIKNVINRKKNEIVDVKKYRYLCDVFLAIIESTYPELLGEVSFDKDTNLCELMINNEHRLIIRPDSTWEDIDRSIKKFITIKKTKNKDCPICYIKTDQYIQCGKCSGIYCFDCCIKMYRSNMGVIKCPFCRDTCRDEVSENSLDEHVNEFKRELDEQRNRLLGTGVTESKMINKAMSTFGNMLTKSLLETKNENL